MNDLSDWGHQEQLDQQEQEESPMGNTSECRPGKVYQAINAVMKSLSADGISKSRKNQQQGYAFRGIDDVYNALSSALSTHGLTMLPRVLSRTCEERTAKGGGALFSVTVEVEFDLVCAEDGSTHTIRAFGEAMDSADKATNKAMSAAYKYAATMAFCIPTEGDNDADAQTPELEVARAPSDWMDRLANTIKNAESDTKLDEIRDFIKSRKLPQDQSTSLGSLINARSKALQQSPE